MLATPRLPAAGSGGANWTVPVRRRLLRRLRDPASVSREDPHTPHGIVRLRPRDSYLRPDRDAVARAAPHLLCPSASLGPGEAFAGVRPDGTPVFAYRPPGGGGGDGSGDDGEAGGGGGAKAFVNRCRHRGSPLVRPPAPHEPVRAAGGGRLICPYHAWTYDASSGELLGAPGRRCGFPGLLSDEGGGRGGAGLIPVECREAAGAVWVGGEALARAGFWDVARADAELDPLLRLPSATAGDDGGEERSPLVGYREWDLAADWQLLVESFLEAYHVSSLHRNTLATVAHSNVMVTDALDEGGRNLRMVVPLKNFDESLPAAVDGPLLPADPFFGQTTTNYFLFPNVSIAVFKRFVVYMTISPTARGHSKVRAFAADHGGSTAEDRSVQERDLESVMAGLEEDWHSAEEIQRGLNLEGAGECGLTDDDSRLTTFLYGRYEGNNVAFLRHVKEAATVLLGRQW